MTSAWQSCQGDYKPLEVFTRGNKTVITRNITEVDDGLYQWEEYAMLTEDYETINTIVKEKGPYTDTKTAYIDDTEVVFTDVPSGALLVSFGNGNMDYSINRDGSTIQVSFEALEEVTEVTITVQ